MYLIYHLKKNNKKKKIKQRKNWTNEVGKKCTPKQEKIWYCIISFPVKLPMCFTMNEEVKVFDVSGLNEQYESVENIMYYKKIQHVRSRKVSIYQVEY